MLRKIFFSGTALLILSTLSLPLEAATFYVDGANGDNTNACTTPDAACKSINGALDRVGEGDTIKIVPWANPYVENITPNFNGLTLEGTGSKASQVVINGNFNNHHDNTLVRNLSIDSSNDNPAVSNTRNMTMEKVIVSGHATYCGGGITTRTAIRPRSLPGQPAFPQTSDTTFIFKDSTVRDSTAGTNGGGICATAYGGNNPTLNIINSTLSGNNAAEMGGGLYINGATVNIYNSTFTNNNATSQGGAIGVASGIGYSLKIYNTIIANNKVGSQTLNCSANDIIEDGAFNLEDINSCSDSSDTTLFPVHGNPSLDSLKDEVGPTPTHGLLAQSPAINAGDPDGCKASGGVVLDTDQRGHVRVERCDIGSVEYVPPGWQPPEPSTPGAPQPGTPGTGEPAAPGTTDIISGPGAPVPGEEPGATGKAEKGCALNVASQATGHFWMVAGLILMAGYLRLRNY